MSIQKANSLLREGKLEEALREYKKIGKNDLLYNSIQANINYIENRLKGKIHSDKSTVKAIRKDEPLVSVIMPVYNVAPYLDASILSVLNQTYSNIEVIIVNDASTDNGISIINMFAQKDNRIKVIDLKFNTLGGAGIPSNIGVNNAKGKYIAYADSDDILDRFAIEKMVNLAEKTDVDVVIADFNNFNDETRKIDIAYDKANWKDLPIEKPFSPKEKPSVFRLSPVPWRKLYKRDFLNKNKIRFPEGDYFYEDNPLHWFVLSKANKVALLDYVVAYHRMAREGQTMGANNYKLSAIYSHVNTINNFLLKQKDTIPRVYWKELVDFAYRCGWVIDRQTDNNVKKIIKKRYSQINSEIYKNSNLSKEEVLKMRPSFFKKIDDYNKEYFNKDLTIIIPIYNCGDLLEETLENISKINLNTEIFLIDDGSTDNSKEICKKYVSKYNNFMLFEQGNKGAGVARNAVIPLATGKYTYFLDADDTINIKNLEEAFKVAEKNDNDLLLFKYKIHFYDKNQFRDMWNDDQKIWNELLKSKTNKEKQKLASQMVNYPWIRLIKTKLLHDENIFFGKTIVHNDIPYHWHSIIGANKIGVFDKPVCNHRKFDTREQITNIKDKRRMMVLEAIRHTYSLLSKYNNYSLISNEWLNFSKHIFNWAKDKIPEELKKEYENNYKKLLQKIEESVK